MGRSWGWERLGRRKGADGQRDRGCLVGCGPGTAAPCVCVFGLDEGHQHTRVHLTCLFLAGVGAGGGCAALEAGWRLHAE